MKPHPDSTLDLAGVKIGQEFPTYFIADIAANHDGDLVRAKDLIFKAAWAGASAAKFQHFSAETIVSDAGFRRLEGQQSHQAKWSKSVFDVYKAASIDLQWTETLKETCKQAGVAFLTSPYSLELVDHVDPYVPAYKIGSGDITWLEMIRHIAAKEKPYILATGASSLEDVHRAVSAGLEVNPKLALLQCNTNYTAEKENFHYVQLNVLNTYRNMYPKMILGLSDHTSGHATVLGAVALGARIIEKHFTDDTTRAGPDHLFSMDPRRWRDMVDRTRELEAALGTGVKEVEENESDTVVLQRRSIRTARQMAAGEIVTRKDLIVLRPSPAGSIPPYRIDEVIARRIRREVKADEHLQWSDLE